LAALVAAGIAPSGWAQDSEAPVPVLELVYFYMEGCPACAEAERLLLQLELQHPQLDVRRFRLPSPEGRALLDDLRESFGLAGVSIPVPTLFLGEVAIVGRTFYGLAEEPFELRGAAWEAGVQSAVEKALSSGRAFVREFCDPTLGFCIGHPLDWSPFFPHGGGVGFAGSAETGASSINVSVQGFAPGTLGEGETGVRDLITLYKYGIVRASARLSIDSSAYPAGDGYVADYVLPGGVFRQWRVAIASGDFVFSWAYTAPADLYDAFSPIAAAMLATWKVIADDR